MRANGGGLSDRVGLFTDWLGENVGSVVLFPLALIVGMLVLLAIQQLTSTLYAILVALAFLVGLLLIPMWGYMLLDSVPVISPLLGALCFTLGSVGNGSNVLTQRADDTYEMGYADTETHGPSGYWTRLALSRFGITYERTRDAFGNAVKDVDLDVLEENDTSELPGPRVEADINRGGGKSYVDVRKARSAIENYSDVVFIAVGEKLAELRDSAGLDVAIRAHAQALKEYGHDSADHTPQMMAITSFVFAILGLLVGYTMLFGI